MISYCISVPVYNEELRLEKGIRKLNNFLSANNFNARIDIADNGSTDKTREIAKRLCAELPNVSLTKVPAKGVGLALQTSWSAATEDIVGYVDVDLSTDISHLLQVDALFKQGHAIVSGSRLKAGAKVIGRSLKRELSSRVFNFVLKQVLNVHFSDGMCGFKFLRRSLYNELKTQGLKQHNWFFNTEVMVRAEWAGHTVAEIPIKWEDDSSSNVKIISLSLEYLKDIWQLRAEQKLKNGTSV